MAKHACEAADDCAVKAQDRDQSFLGFLFGCSGDGEALETLVTVTGRRFPAAALLQALTTRTTPTR